MIISEIRGEAAVNLLADLIEPVTAIATDKAITELRNGGETSAVQVAKVAVKRHASDVVEILAACNGVKKEDYNGNIIDILHEFVELINDEEIMNFFGFVWQTAEGKTSGSATESIGDEEK